MRKIAIKRSQREALVMSGVSRLVLENLESLKLNCWSVLVLYKNVKNKYLLTLSQKMGSFYFLKQRKEKISELKVSASSRQTCGRMLLNDNALIRCDSLGLFNLTRMFKLCEKHYDSDEV
jgi:hypothetical protein